jgi:hypothetical protein
MIKPLGGGIAVVGVWVGPCTSMELKELGGSSS